MRAKHILLSIIILTLFITVLSCKDKKVREAEKIVNEWMGKEILFPDATKSFIFDRDTVCADLFEKEYKVLLYVDSTGCTDCKLGLRNWLNYINEADSIVPGKVGFLFFFYPKNERELTFLAKRDQFNYPIFIDRRNEIDRLNHFPKEPSYQCFLLDKNNKVLSIGNPKQNPMVWKLYKQIITGEQETGKQTLTTVEVEQATIEPVTMQAGKKAEVVFRLKNTGDKALAIHDIKTSCGCTVPLWSKEPVAPGKTTSIQVEVKPESDGYFHKTVDVFCNTKENPVKLTIKGNVTK